MLPQDFESIEAENQKNDEQYYQPYIDQIIMKHFCCYSSENEIYQSTVDQKFICKECYRFKITFFESGTSVPFLKGVFSWIGRISKRFLEFYCEKTVIDFLMRFRLKVLLTLRLQNSGNLNEKICTVWPLQPCEHRPSKKSCLMVPTKSQKWLV